MSNTRKHSDAWIGVIMFFSGLALIYYGLDFSSTNIAAAAKFVDPRITGVLLVIIGCTTLTFAIGMMLVRFMTPKRS